MTIFSWCKLVHFRAKMHLRIEASRYYLGYIWWILEPLLFVTVFYIVFKVVLQSGSQDYLLFLLCGKIPFLWFSKTILNASNSIRANRNLIGQIDLPKIIFPYISILESLYKQVVLFVLLFFYLAISNVYPHWIWFWLIPLIITQLVFIVCVSLACAFFTSFIPDFLLLISMGLLFLMFSSGVFWDVGALNDLAIQKVILEINPVAFILDSYRKILIHNITIDYNHLILIFTLASIFIVLFHLLYHATSRKIAAVVLSQ